jgi:hypothetical protein
MENNEKYFIYDWELGIWVERTEEEYKKYKKLIAELHDIMFPKVEVPLKLKS